MWGKKSKVLVHPICPQCLRVMPNQREPIVLQNPHCLAEYCCFCGQYTSSGLYYKAAVEPLRFPEQHCRAYGRLHVCNCERVTHPDYGGDEAPDYEGGVIPYGGSKLDGVALTESDYLAQED